MLQNIKSSYFIKLIYTFIEEAQKLKLVRYNKSLQKNLNISLNNYKFISGRYIIYESNGFGKEYDGEDDTLKFEGEYSNGKRHGKGKEYYSTGELIFEGEYLNGKRHGKGKEYDKFGKIKFEGEYLNGKRNGKGKEYNKYGELIFEGEYLNGKNWSGKGYYSSGNIVYELKDGKGLIKEYYNNRLIFEGE